MEEIIQFGCHLFDSFVKDHRISAVAQKVVKWTLKEPNEHWGSFSNWIQDNCVNYEDKFGVF